MVSQGLLASGAPLSPLEAALPSLDLGLLPFPSLGVFCLFGAAFFTEPHTGCQVVVSATLEA